MIKLLKLTGALLLVFVSVFQSFGISRDKNYEILSKKDFSPDRIECSSGELPDKGVKVSVKAETDCFNYLLSCGYPKEFLQAVTDSTLKNIVSLISNNEISDVTYDTKQLSENSNIIVETIVAKMKDPHTGRIVGESVCVYWKQCDKKPLIGEEDFVSARWNKNLFVYDDESFYAEDYCKDNQTGCWSVSDSYTKLSRVNLNNVGHWSVPKTNKNVTGGSMMFNLLAVSPLDNVNYNNNLEVEYTRHYELPKVIIIVFAVFSVAVLIITLKIRKKEKIKPTK